MAGYPLPNEKATARGIVYGRLPEGTRNRRMGGRTQKNAARRFPLRQMPRRKG